MDNPNNGNLPDTQDTDIVETNDMLNLKMLDMTSKLIGFYDSIAQGDPEIVEAWMKKYPRVAQARLRIAPVTLARVLPPAKHSDEPVRKPMSGKRLSQADLLNLGVSPEKLRELAGVGDDNERNG